MAAVAESPLPSPYLPFQKNENPPETPPPKETSFEEGYREKEGDRTANGPFISDGVASVSQTGDKQRGPVQVELYGLASCYRVFHKR